MTSITPGTGRSNGSNQAIGSLMNILGRYGRGLVLRSYQREFAVLDGAILLLVAAFLLTRAKAAEFKFNKLILAQPL